MFISDKIDDNGFKTLWYSSFKKEGQASKSNDLYNIKVNKNIITLNPVNKKLEKVIINANQ